MKPKILRSLASSLSITLVSSVLTTGLASATDIVWGTNLGAGPWVWNTGANWTGGTAPVVDTDRGDLRKDWTAAATINLNAATIINGILFDDTGTSGDVGVTIGNGGTAANTLTLAGTTPVIQGSGSTLTIGTVLAGTTAWSKTGGGTVVLNNAANTITGTATVVSGVLQIRDGSTNTPAVFNNLTGKSITVQSGTLDLPRLHASTNQGITWTLPPVSLEAGSTLRFRASTGSNTHGLAASLSNAGSTTINNNGGAFAQDINLTGILSGSGTINYLASSASGSSTTTRTLTLNNTGTSFSGNWFVDYTAATSDDFVALRSNAAGALGTGTVTLDDRARLINNAANGINSLAGVSLLKSTSFLDLNGANSWNNTSASLTLNAGTVTLATSNSAIGALNLAGSATINSNGGTLAFNSILVTAGTTSGTGVLVPANSATIANTGAPGSATIANALELNNSGINFNLGDTNPGGSDLFLTGTINSSAGFTKSGAGALSFNNTTNVSGLVTHNAGIIQISSTPTKSFTGGLTGTGQINVGGTGVVTLAGASAGFSGTINVADGASLAGEAVTNANLTLGGTTGANLWPDFSTLTGSFTANNITLNGVNTIRFNTFPGPGVYTLLKYNGLLTGTAANFSAPFRGASIDTTGGVGDNEIALTIGAAASLVWNNAATTSIWDNTISANWNNAGSDDVFFEQDSVTFNDSPGTDQAISITDAVVPASVTFPTSNDNVNYTLSGGSISGLGNLVKSGDAMLSLASANSYSGGTTLNEGRLRVGDNSALGTGTLTINGGVLSSNSSSPWTVPNLIVLNTNPTFGNATDNGALTLSGSVSLDASRTITTLSDVTLSGVLGGAFSLTKSGAGTLALTGANTYSGATTVSAGTLSSSLSTTLNSLGSGPVTIDSGTTLQINNLNTATATGPTFASTVTGSGLLKYDFAAGTTARNSYITGLAGFTGTLQLTNSGSNGDKLNASAGINAPGASVIVDSGSQLYINTAASTFAGVSLSGTGNSENRGALRFANTLNAPITLAGSTTIGAEGGTLNGTITSGAAGTQTLTVGTTNSTGNSTFLGAIGGGTGTIDLIKVAAGTMTLAAANTYTGNTYIDQGVLNLTGSIAGDLFVSNAQVATLSGEGSVGGIITLGATGVNADLVINPNTSGALTSTGDLALAESGTVVSVSLTNPPDAGGTYNVIQHGGTTATPANFSFANAAGYRPATFDTTTNAAIVTLTIPTENLTWLGTTAVWDVDSTANWKSSTVDPEKFFNLDVVTFDDTATIIDPTLAVTVSPGGVLFANSTKPYTLTGAGAIAGAGTLAKTGSNTVTLSTPNTFTGNVTVSGGKLVLGNAGALGASSAGAKSVIVSGTGQLDLNNFNNATPTRTYTLALSGAGDGTGAVLNNAGTGIFANAGMLNVVLNDHATIGGTQRYDLGFAAGAGAGIITGNGKILTKTGANQINLRGDASASPYSVIVNQGILAIENTATAIGGASGSATVNNGAVLGTQGALTIETPVTLNGGSTLRNLGGAAATWSSTLTLGGNSTLEGNAANVVNLIGSLAQSGGAHALEIKNTTTTGGSYTFNLSNTSTRTGPTTLTGSLFKVDSPTALGSGPVTIQGNGTATVVTRLDLQGVAIANDINLSSTAQTGFFGPVTAVGGLTSTVSGIMNVTAGVGNGGHFASSGAGSVLRLSGTLNSTGVTPNFRQGTIEMATTGGNLTQLNQGEGTIRLVANNGIQTSVRLNLAVSGAGTLDLNGFTQTLAELRRQTTHAATVTNGAVTGSILTINGAVDHTYAGTVIDGTGGISIVKAGSSVWTLTGANTYTGTTTINSGTLLINASHTAATGDVTVNNGGTLGGTSTVGGAITVESGGALAPGASIGTLTTNAAVTLESGAIFDAEINSSTPAADQLFANGAVTVSGATLSVTDIAVSPAPITPGTKLTLIDYGSNTFTGTFNGLPEGATVPGGINNFTISYDDGGKVTLTSTGTGDPFVSWAAASGLDGSPGKEAGFDDDPELDGIANGLEWILGGGPLAQDAASLVDVSGTAAGGLTLTFTRVDESIGQATLEVEYDADLAGTWTAVNIEGTPPFANGVTVNITPGSPEDGISVNIPAVPNALGGKLFGRLRATKP